MQEEGQFVVRLVAAHVARERVLVSMVTHVHGVHDDVLESHVAIGALISRAPRRLGIRRASGIGDGSVAARQRRRWRRDVLALGSVNRLTAAR